MKSTSNSNTKTKAKEQRQDKFLVEFFGGFLLKKSMRPWLLYGVFVLVLATFLVISEQRIRVKQRKITELENVYKSEITKLKANNQFIPYEKNKILIGKMQAKGFITDDKHIYTVKKTPKEENKRRWWRRKEAKGE